MSPAQDLTFEKWRKRIQLCVTQEELLLMLAAYFGTWRASDINRFPPSLTSSIGSIDELHHRAVDLVRTEVTFKGRMATGRSCASSRW